MDSASCESGMKSTVTSHSIEVSSSKLLEFDYYLNLSGSYNTGNLSVFAFFTASGLFKKKLLTISKRGTILNVKPMKSVVTDQNNWKRMTVLLPLGSYILGFESICGVPYKSNMAIDNVHVWEAESNEQLKNGTELGNVTNQNFSPHLDESKDYDVLKFN